MPRHHPCPKMNDRVATIIRSKIYQVRRSYKKKCGKNFESLMDDITTIEVYVKLLDKGMDCSICYGELLLEYKGRDPHQLTISVIDYNSPLCLENMEFICLDCRINDDLVSRGLRNKVEISSIPSNKNNPIIIIDDPTENEQQNTAVKEPSNSAMNIDNLLNFLTDDSNVTINTDDLLNFLVTDSDDTIGTS